MTPQDSPEARIAEIRERLSKIGPYPWTVRHGTANGWEICSARGGLIAIEAWHGAPEHDFYKERFVSEGEFCAHAPSDVEYLLARLHEQEQSWRCFHCGEVFTTVGAASDHFGTSEGAKPGCLIDRVALEEGGKPEQGRGLLMALRKAESRAEAAEAKAHEQAQEIERLQEQERQLWWPKALLMRAEAAESALAAAKQEIERLKTAARKLLDAIEAADNPRDMGVERDADVCLDLARLL